MTGPLPGPWLPLAAGAFGWVWGSFLNTIVDRTPSRESGRHGGGSQLGWFSPPRSVCLACAAPIPWHDNVPILSYLLLRGRCRACGAAIGWRTLAVEIVTPISFALGASLGGTALPWPWLAWSAALLSTFIAAVPLGLERRRMTLVALAGAALGVLAAALYGLG